MSAAKFKNETTKEIKYRNQYRNMYHLICRVISICLCALFCLSFGCTSKKEERLQEIDLQQWMMMRFQNELKTIIDQKKQESSN